MTRKECLKNGHIRIGWDIYGEHITDETDFSVGKGKAVLNAFINKMQYEPHEPGDVIIITDDSPDGSSNVDYVLRSEFTNALNNKATAIGTPSDGQFLVYSSASGAYVPTTVISADNIKYGGTT